MLAVDVRHSPFDCINGSLIDAYGSTGWGRALVQPSLHLSRAQELGLQQGVPHLQVLHINGQLAHA